MAMATQKLILKHKGKSFPSPFTDREAVELLGDFTDEFAFSLYSQYMKTFRLSEKQQYWAHMLAWLSINDIKGLREHQAKHKAKEDFVVGPGVALLEKIIPKRASKHEVALELKYLLNPRDENQLRIFRAKTGDGCIFVEEKIYHRQGVVARVSDDRMSFMRPGAIAKKFLRCLVEKPEQTLEEYGRLTKECAICETPTEIGVCEACADDFGIWRSCDMIKTHEAALADCEDTETTDVQTIAPEDGGFGEGLEF